MIRYHFKWQVLDVHFASDNSGADSDDSDDRQLIVGCSGVSREPAVWRLLVPVNELLHTSLFSSVSAVCTDKQSVWYLICGMSITYKLLTIHTNPQLFLSWTICTFFSLACLHRLAISNKCATFPPPMNICSIRQLASSAHAAARA